MEFIWLLALLGFSHGKLTTKSLDDVIVYAEDLGEVRLYHQSWTLINVIDSDNLYNRLHQIHTALELVKEQCIVQSQSHVGLWSTKKKIDKRNRYPL